ncbi:MAG TPA: NAD(P)H-hydrate dehydratase [Kofleriaceae bacterium]|nr:NAD(P)H-hydrate dehydratase [Kofleriaceae bacterium]
MRYVLTAGEMRALDAATISDIGLPGAVLMENAGRAVAEDVLAELGGGGTRVAVVCGAGNNGGDGYVIARWLREAGVHASVYLAVADDRVGGDARLHLNAYLQTGGPVLSVASAEDLTEHRDAIADAECVIDCLFGTGLDRPVDGHFAAIIGVMNRAAGTRVAVDIPSGLCADTGQILGTCFEPDRTVTMAFLKVGLTISPGFARCGEVRVAAIGIPRQLAQAQGVRIGLLEERDARLLLPVGSALDHKNRRGHVLAIAGSPGKRGAGRLTAWAAMRSGAGLVTLAGPGGDDGAADPVMTADLSDVSFDELVTDKRVVAMGPGMDPGPAGRALVLEALRVLEQPLVLDADALNHLGGDLEVVAASAPPVVLTPHPGEAGRLLGCSTADVERDRVDAVRQLAARTRAVVVLKGARTLTCDGIAGDGFVTVNPTGNAGLATAGSGDVLTGIIAALIAQGASPGDAARAGAWVHGHAADLLLPDLGERGITAADLIEALPRALR